jgi:hypothetical protein
MSLFNVADDAYLAAWLSMGDCDEYLGDIPRKQKARVDFALTKRYLGVDAVCLTKIKTGPRAVYGKAYATFGSGGFITG